MDVFEQEHRPHRSNKARTNQYDGESSGIAQFSVGDEPAGLSDGPHCSRHEARQYKLRVDGRFVSFDGAVHQEVEDRCEQDAAELVKDIVQSILRGSLLVVLNPRRGQEVQSKAASSSQRGEETQSSPRLCRPIPALRDLMLLHQLWSCCVARAASCRRSVLPGALPDEGAVQERADGEAEAEDVQPRTPKAALLARQAEEAEEAREPADQEGRGAPGHQAGPEADVPDDEDRGAVACAPNGSTTEGCWVEGRRASYDEDQQPRTPDAEAEHQLEEHSISRVVLGHDGEVASKTQHRDCRAEVAR
mmetsp:Transcript_53918/g.157328  ORF Transcript_53918/g.157328 Transcript_53918/m.157328 type:complete len:305 (-) Transcript_53918:61-975(-)